MEIERLRPVEMDRHVAAGTFRLALIGMSNAGKSYRSRILRDEGNFFWYEVDAHIQTKLNLADMQDISSWLGYPTSDTYVERAATYLHAEEACTYLQSLDTQGKNLVFDTTGSVIYLSPKTRSWLHDDCLVVHIDVGEDSIGELCERYFAEPKPVLWDDAFQPHAGEDPEVALRRCYPMLLQSRIHKYRELAHLSIPVEELYDASAEQTLSVIRSYLA